MPSIVLLNSYPKIRGNANDVIFLIFCIILDSVQVFWNITCSAKNKKRGIITHITSFLIIKPKIKSVDEIIEYNIFWLSMNLLKNRKPANIKHTEGALLKEVCEYAKKIVARPSINASNKDVVILYLKAREIKKKVATERDEKNGL